ncbi:MAG: FAD-binding oxidoreductase, partial [Acidimicrobiales bacterium]|nr:FAD-binding oxidoreductase [Acidimicrobiales bacterium]
ESKVSYSALFESFTKGADACRELVQSGLNPANCRLLDPLEAFISGAGDGTRAVLIVGFESGDHPVDHLEKRSIEIVMQNGGVVSGKKENETWKSSFIRAPYIRDSLIRLGLIAETFETAIKWNKFEEFHRAILESVTNGIERVAEGKGLVTCRLTHLYPDGAAPYFTVLAKARSGSEISQWMEIKELASQAILENGGTITHHHAVGRDHQKWYKSEIPEPIYRGFEALKHHFDPQGILNPGVVINL